MDTDTVLVFTANGMGNAEPELRLKLAKIFLGLLATGGMTGGRICFYTEGVKLACEGSPVLDELASLQRAGAELVLCKTCLDYFGLASKVKVGVVGGMPDIIEAMSEARKVITL
jgi:sulfur relay (sulfurtransferase) complex TusBCD TusD component (DsrE family)